MQSFSVKSKYCFISGIHLYGACAASYPSAGEEVFHMADNFTDHTQTFNFEALQQPDMQQILTLVYDALKEKGYNPIAKSWDISSLRTPPISRRTTTRAA